MQRAAGRRRAADAIARELSSAPAAIARCGSCTSPGGCLDEGGVLALQRHAGNRAVAELLERRGAGAAERGPERGGEGGARRLAVARDGLAPGDTAPQDEADRRAGGRARANLLYGRQCDPYADPLEAWLQQQRLQLEVPLLVEAALPGPANVDAANVWRRYLAGTGGMETHDGIAAPGDRIAAAFRDDERHRDAEDRVLSFIRSAIPRLGARLAGAPSLTFSFDDLGVPPPLRQADPFYDGDAFTVAANLAGGIGESDFGRDSRRIEGRVTLDKRPDPSNRLWTSVGIRVEFDWEVRDGIDFCPGNAGNPVLQEWLTIPMSRLEAMGRTRDVGLLVRFRRVRHDTPVEIPNPDILTPAAPRQTITLPAEALFEFGSDELSGGARTALFDRLGDQPERADPDRRVEVRGHTDAIGGDDSNQALSERRAAAVQAALETRYPNLRGRIDTRGFGESQPVAPNELGGRDNPEGRRRNRRVEIDMRVAGPDPRSPAP